MIKGRFIGQGVYVKEFDETYSWEELNKCSLKKFKQLCSFLNEKELDKILNNANLSNSKCTHIMNIFDRL